MREAKQFQHSSIREMEYDDKRYYHFEAAMISTCEPLFDLLDDNYEVEDELRKAKVIRANTKTDTESCALVITFSTRKAGENFIDRLNKYLLKKAGKQR